MENQENEMEQEEINSEQFPVGRSPEQEKLPEQEDSQYTEEETGFTDRAGSEQAEEFDIPKKEDLEDDFDSDLQDLEFDQHEQDQ